MKFHPSLLWFQIVKMTTSSVVSSDNFIRRTIFSFRWMYSSHAAAQLDVVSIWALGFMWYCGQIKYSSSLGRDALNTFMRLHYGWCLHGNECKQYIGNAPHMSRNQLGHACMESPISLQWRHNERDGVSNHQRPQNWLNHLFRRRSKKTSNLRVTGLCAGNSPVTSEFTSQKASNAENVSIWWRHQGVAEQSLNK